MKKTILSIATILFLTACGSSSSTNDIEENNTLCENKDIAYEEAQDFVKLKILYPGPIFGEEPTEYNYLENCTHHFIGKVDAQNSFGTYRTYNFEVEVRYNENRKDWVSSGSEAELW